MVGGGGSNGFYRPHPVGELGRWNQACEAGFTTSAETTAQTDTTMEPSALTTKNATIALTRASEAADPYVRAAWIRLAEAYEQGARLLDLLARGEARLRTTRSEPPPRRH